MITKYNIYNESIRDKMTPKSEDEIVQMINTLDIDTKIEGLYGSSLRMSIYENDQDNVEKIMDYMYDDYTKHLDDKETKEKIEECYSVALEKAIKGGSVDMVEIVLYTDIDGINIDHMDDAVNHINMVVGGEEISEDERESFREIAKMVYKDKRTQSLLTRKDREYYDYALNESVRDMMTPKSGSQIDEMFKGKSYKQSLNIVTKSKEPDLVMRVMKSDFVTNRQINDVDMVFKKIVRNNYCRVSHEPTLKFELDLTYSGSVDITRSDNDFLRSVMVGIVRLTESEIEYHKLDSGKSGYPVFWYFVKLLVGSNREKLRWRYVYYDNFDEMVEYLKKSGLDV